MIAVQKVQEEKISYLNRREILESLVRQGVYGVSRLKDACRAYERVRLERISMLKEQN